MSEAQGTSTTPPMAASGSALRAADALLRLAGGRTMLLRMPAPAVAADPAEQLGLATPQFQDFPIAPVVFRKARATVTNGQPPRWELLVSASAVEQLVGSLAYASASVLFATAFGVLCDDELLEILSATEQQAYGAPYCYRLVVRTPTAQTT